jgi:ribosomal protein S18 acetylase RimI-like enzyme
MTIVVRPLKADDVDVAVDIFARCGTARHPERPTPPDRLQQVRATISAPFTWTFVTTDADRVIAFATAMPSHEDEGAGPAVPGLCYLDLIFVDPECWGKHIGAILLDTVIADARSRGFTRIHLITHDDNDRAHRPYESRGFVRSGWSRMSSDPTNGMVSDWARRL